MEVGLSTVGVDTGQWAGRSRKRGLNPGRGQRFSKTPRSSQGPTHEPSIRRVPDVFSSAVKRVGQGAYKCDILPTLRVRGALPQVHHMLLLPAQGQLHFTPRSIQQNASAPSLWLQ